ncbi:AaceriABL042Wp [[Ashbya] aceris (nom. inval.)]|nr:AaceriABL042Wp [[Ashbya] aceris (nom. inval.)]
MSREARAPKVTFKDMHDEDSEGRSTSAHYGLKPDYEADGENNDKDNDGDREYEEDDEEEDEEEEDGDDSRQDTSGNDENGEGHEGGREDSRRHITQRADGGVVIPNRPQGEVRMTLIDPKNMPRTPTRGRPPKRKFGRSASPDLSKAGPGFTTSIPGNSKRPRLPYPVDERGNPLPVINDEYTLPDDPEGERKITRDGDLLGGRQFLVRTFTLTGRGQTKYMLSTEPARAVGFRDSYLFFQYHPNLYKLVISQDERNDLIDRGVIPYSYRSRAIALVTARSVYKEFGAHIIVDGKNITDDYYATKLRAEGKLVEGTYAREPISKNGTRSDGWDYPQSNINPARNAVEFFDKKNHNIAPGSNISATNWLYQHAAACSRFNSDLFYDRERVLLIENLGLRDPYTNTLHLPQSTQPSKVLAFRKLRSDTDQIIYSTHIHDSDVARRKTGLADVPPELFEDIVSDEVKEAILKQQEFERTN